MVTLKNLMIGITRDLIFFIDKTFKQRQHHGFILLANAFVIGFINIFKNIMETTRLIFIGTTQIIFVTVEMILAQIVQQ